MAERVGFELLLILKEFVTYKSLTKVSSVICTNENGLQVVL